MFIYICNQQYGIWVCLKIGCSRQKLSWHKESEAFQASNVGVPYFHIKPMVASRVRQKLIQYLLECVPKLYLHPIMC